MSSLADNNNDGAIEGNDVMDVHNGADTLDNHDRISRDNDNHDDGNKDDNSNHDGIDEDDGSNVHALNLDYSKWSGVDIIESMCMNCGKLLSQSMSTIVVVMIHNRCCLNAMYYSLIKIIMSMGCNGM